MEPYRHKVKYYECDPMGVVHHSNYVRFMEEARVEMMDRLGFGYERMEADGVISPVLSLTCKFLRPAHFQEVVEISVRLSSSTAMKVSFAYEMRVEGNVVMTAESTHCFLENGRPVSLEKRFPEFFAVLSELR
ncbi:MAG: acyl-CoA thioesterase [Bacteroidales bacterium]|jgi:acyl-CoA thioester hydrolase|nr:acyl-CoA thioesterase [Bacteroidales bacterium]